MSKSPIQSILQVEDLISDDEADAEIKDESSEDIQSDEDVPMVPTKNTSENNIENNNEKQSGPRIENQKASQDESLSENNRNLSSQSRKSFKILQISEHGRTYLTTVPSAWEKLGILYWPNTTNVFIMQKLIQNGNSKPEKYWFSQPCKLIKGKFKSYKDAETTKKKMEEQDYFNTTKQLTKLQQIQTKDLRDINETDSDDTQSMTSNQELPIKPQLTQNDNVNSKTNKNLVLLKSNIQPNNTEKLDISVKLESINKNIKQMLQNQNKMLVELAKQSVLNDVLTDRLNEVTKHKIRKATSLEKEKPVTRGDSKKNQLSTETTFLDDPIANQEELDNLENNLNDSAKIESLISKMKSYCGETGTIDPTNCCYNLVDRFFTRSFLLNVSWSGGSRTGSQKLALRNYRNVLQVFNKLVILASKDFDEHKSREFFKTVLRNAKKRYGSELDSVPRKSTKKVRKKTLESKKADVSDWNDDIPVYVDILRALNDGINEDTHYNTEFEF